uniref:Response regulator receiver protein n=1 Tax=Polynucleobacter necessarius subsp. necessarius (strain STIR1) TaxID=452638 RepID=B1XUA3_POLNS
MKPVWIVDDDQSIRWVLEKALSHENIPHKSFSNPNDVLSDIRMPRGNGLDLLQHVKVSHPNLPVIIMTAYSDLDSAVSSFQGGAFEYLTKPFDVEKAVELIHPAVEQGIRNDSGTKELTAWRQDATEIIG